MPISRVIAYVVLGLSVATLLAVLARGVAAIWPERAYDARTPEAMLDSAAAMVRDKRADRLPELLEIDPDVPRADRDRVEDLYARLGRVFGAAQALADTFASELPGEVERLAAEAEGGGTNSILSAVASGRGGPFGGGPGDDAGSRQLAALLADPYALIDDGRDRLSVEPLDSESAALLWDERPVLPPFGLVLRKGDDNRWRFASPSRLPGLSSVWPRTEPEYRVWASLLTTVEQLLVDLEADLAAGRVSSAEQLGRRAIERGIVPLGLVFVALERSRREDGP
ncbi:MAG: hypothetical protein AAF356_10215 [Planctomycetota bacterium]